jgi:uroporphyrinogen-III synthase
MTRVLITRPWEDAEPLAAWLTERGHEALIDPMLDIERLPAPEDDRTGVQGLLFTSANGVRAYGSPVDPLLPVYAVGAATAAAARSLGFQAVVSAAGDVSALAALVIESCTPTAGVLLHIAASDRAGDLAGLLTQAGFDVHRQVRYRARPAEALTPATVAALTAGKIDVALLFSPRTARTLGTAIALAGLAGACRVVTAACLSAPVAEAAAEAVPWGRLWVATSPTQESLLAVLDESDTGEP